MQRPEQHEIDEAARRVLKNALPTAWIRRAQSPDYGIDYQYETVEAGKVRGLSFAVQLKGKRSFEIRNETVTYQLETRHLKYYVDDQRYPVFLVVVDATEGKGWWLFLQGYAMNELAKVNWRSQDSIVVHVPTENEITKVDALFRAVEEADRTMAELRPAAIKGAIAAERKRMESLDPRFRIEVTATEGGSHYQMNAVEPVTISVTFKGGKDKVSRMVEDLIDRGLPVDIKPGDIEAKGSPLFEESLNNKELKIHFAKKMSASVKLASFDKNDREVAYIDPFPAQIEGGMKEFRLNAPLSHTPLSLQLQFELKKDFAKHLSAHATLGLSLNEWSGQRILQLAHFDQVHRLISAQRDGCDLRVRCLIDGNEFMTFRGNPAEFGITREFAYAVDVLRKARDIARWVSQRRVNFGEVHVDSDRESGQASSGWVHFLFARSH